jgi:hypothetical protein
VGFAMETFKHNPYLIFTGDWNYDLKFISDWDGQSQVAGEALNGKELLIIAKPNIRIK